MTLKVGADVLFRGCLSSCMPNPVEALLEVYEDMIKILLVLQIFLTEDSYVEDLLCGTPSSSEACLFFSNDLLCLWLQSVQYDLQHDFAWVADEADRSVILRVAFLWKCNNITLCQTLDPQPRQKLSASRPLHEHAQNMHMDSTAHSRLN